MTKSSDKKPRHGGKSGPGSAFDEDGELIFFGSPSSMGYGPKPKPPKDA